MKTIVFTGGGTAGHIMPNIAIIEKLKNYRIYYLGTNGMEKNILSDYKNVTFIEIETVKLVRSLTPKNLLIPFKLIRAISSTKKILKEIKPDIIFSKGGYVSLPVCIAGHSQKIPIITHESDFTLGLANKIIARLSKKLCCSFQDTAKKYGKNAIFTGSPIRQKILEGDGNIVKTRHQINPTKKVVLIVGGSLGAKKINNTIWDNIQKLTREYTIIHIVGKNNCKKNLLSQKDYYQVEFAKDIENYFALSDVIISRAGSNTIFEILSINKPMILIPLPKSNGSRGDQELNAEYFKNKGYAEVIPQDTLNIDILLDTIKKSIRNTNQNKNSANQIIGTEKIIELINQNSL